jgi:galactokinase
MDTLREAIENGSAARAFESLYGVEHGDLDRQKARYRGVLDRFADTFPHASTPRFFSTPGRAEIGGNHTDHNGGKVLAAAVNLDAVAVAAPTTDGRIIIDSQGYPRQEMRIDDLARRNSELSTATALTRGVAARMRETGCAVGGFCACITSDVLKGSGLSSSASYEVLIATILNHLFNGGRIGGVEIALVAQFSENEYFGKPCGLMDQITCALGGFVTIDFQNATRPQVRAVNSDFSASGHVPVIVDTGGSHADLTEAYASVKQEMKAVSLYFGGSVLRDVSRDRVLAELPRLRGKVGDRAILRALHFYADDLRVGRQVQALEEGRIDDFLRLVRESGVSSWTLLQNCYLSGSVEQQGIPLALALSETLLGGCGAWRVHGGGFAGTILAFIPNSMIEKYISAMAGVFGPSSCHALAVRAKGAMMLDVV